jgi:ABC-type dipeptide/oligopeptide/nickel transport system permease component
MAMKKMSWAMTGMYFLWTLAAYLGFCSLSTRLREQMGSIHSTYWQYTFPFALGCIAFFTFSMRFIRNRMIAARTAQV